MHNIDLKPHAFLETFQAELDAFELTVPLAELSERIPLDDCPLELQHEIFTLSDTLSSIIDIVFHLFHLVNTFGLSELVQKLVNIIDLLEIIINVAKDFRHLILEHFNEVLLFVGGRITVHLVATISDFLEHVLGSCQSLAQLVRFLC